MKFNRFYFAVSFSLLVGGCAGLTGQQVAAPVYDPYSRAPAPNKSTVPAPVAKTQTPAESAVITTPLEPSVPPHWATAEIRPEVQAESLSPVVVALISDADRNAGSGNLDSAAAVLERGLRIEPRNATLIYKLAEVRLKQSQPRLAEDLAKKSVLLAGSDTELKKKSWLLVAKARKMQGNETGAKEAEFKASEL